MRKKDTKRITVFALIFTVFMSLFSSLVSASPESSVEVKMDPPTKEIVKLTPSESTVSFALTEGTHALSAEAEYDDGSKADVTAEGQWTSSDKSVVNVTRGVITAVKVGSTNVQFSIGTAVLNVEVNVTKDVLVSSEKPQPPNGSKIVSLILSANKIAYVTEGEKRPVVLKALYSDGKMKDVSKSAKWESGDSSIAQVTDGVVKGITHGDVALKVTYSTFPEINFFVSVEAKFDLARSLLLSANQLRLEASDDPVNVEAHEQTSLDSKNVTTLGNWTTTDPKVAIVNESGQITPVGVGRAYVYFKWDNLVDAVLVNVVEPKELVTDTPIVEILPNASWEAVLTEVFSDGYSEDVSSKAVWSVEDPSIATVSDTGFIRAGGKTGRTKVTASYRSDLHPSVEIEVVITNKLTIPRPIGLTASPTNFLIGAGESQPVEITEIYSDGSTKDVTEEIEAIDVDGENINASLFGNKVTGHKNGTAVVRAVYGRQIVDIPVIVADQYDPDKPAIAKSISVTPNVTNMVVHEQQQMKVEVSYTDGTVLDQTAYSSFNSNNPEVITIQDGQLTAVGVGTAIVSVNSADHTEKFTIVVSETPEPPSVNRVVELIPSETDITFPLAELTHSFSVEAKYQDGSTADVTSGGRYTSLDTDIVTIENGVLTGVAPGTTQILINHGTSIEILDVTILPENSDHAPAEDLKIESLLVTSFDVAVQKDKLHPFRISAQYNDGAQREITKSMKWKSMDPKIAVVTDGKITGKKIGITVVIGTMEGFPPIKIPVKVNAQEERSDLVGLDLGGDGFLLMQEGYSPVDFIAFAEYKDHNVVEVDQDGTWESSDESVATVDENGVITPVGNGEAYITFRYHEGFNDQVWVRVATPKLIPSKTDVVLEPDEMTDITLDAIFGRGIWGGIDVTGDSEWTVADKSVATISDSGRIIPQSVGKTTMTATYRGVSTEINVEVVDKHPTRIVGISASPSYIVSSVGTRSKTGINALLSDGTEKDITAEVTWRMSNPDVAYVTEDDHMEAKSEGAAAIQAEYEGFKVLVPIVITP
jgi:hypothetical protein